jgi:glycosyltransferase involved in cell wall biosynthesis
MGEPHVSVLIATYNQSEYLMDALESLAGQSMDDFEAIVINDGSTDSTRALLQDAGYEWLRVIDRNENLGLVPSCNQGLEVANGEYFARLDSDDIVKDQWLSLLFGRLKQAAGACCVIPDRYILHPSGSTEIVRIDLDNIYSFVAAGTMFRTDAVRAVGGFRQFYWEEFDLYLRLRDKGSFIRIDEPLYVYRQHKDSMTDDREGRLDGWRELVAEWGPKFLRSAGSHPDLDEVLKCLGSGG